MKRRIPMTTAERLESRGGAKEQEDGRPPLMPLANVDKYDITRQPQRYSCENKQPQRVFFSRSDQTDNSPHNDRDDDDKFELMNVTVVIYGLSGIMCEKDEGNKRKGKLSKRDKGTKGGEDDVGRISGSTISSFEPSASEEGFNMENLGAPTTAVVSYRKHAYSSQTALETFLPSVPLRQPMSSSGTKYRYQASWPSEQSKLNHDDSAIERSSFNLTRCMQQEAFVPGVCVGANYVHETLELRLSLSRGTELLRLGSGTLVISGEEEGEIQMNIPVQPLVQKKKLTKKRLKMKSNKYGFFSGDLTRRFFVDENTTLRVGVRVVPQDAMKIAQERERKEKDLRQMLGSQDLKQMIEKMGDVNKRDGEAKWNFYNINPSAGRSPRLDGACSQSLFQNIFSCGAMLCATDLVGREEPETSDIPSEIHATDFGHPGVGSLISSVSESSDGCEVHSEGDLEAEYIKFRMTTDLRRFT